jgi:hypothetical protein
LGIWAGEQFDHVYGISKRPQGERGREGAENFGLSLGVETRIFHVLGSHNMKYWLWNEILGEN